MAHTPDDDQYSEQETVARREAALKRMLNTAPKRHSELKIGNRTGKKKVPPKKRKLVGKS